MSEHREHASIFILGGGLFCFLLAGAVLVLAPWLAQKQAQQTITTVDNKTVPAPEFTDAELHGREIYIRENCFICHSQVVRGAWVRTADGNSVEMKSKGGDAERYGPVSQPGESGRDVPQLYGTRRIGPDLAREGGKFADAWHVSHFLDPQAVTPGSMMPKLTWLYVSEVRDGKTVMGPTVELMDLISYMQSLGVNIGDWRGAGTGAEFNEDDFKALFAKSDEVAKMAKAGREDFLRFNCNSCHGQEGRGDGPAGAAYPDEHKPRDYHDKDGFKWGWDPVNIRTTIQKGRAPYMPAHPQLNDQQLAELTAYVMGLAGK